MSDILNKAPDDKFIPCNGLLCCLTSVRNPCEECQQADPVFPCSSNCICLIFPKASEKAVLRHLKVKLSSRWVTSARWSTCSSAAPALASIAAVTPASPFLATTICCLKLLLCYASLAFIKDSKRWFSVKSFQNSTLCRSLQPWPPYKLFFLHYKALLVITTYHFSLWHCETDFVDMGIEVLVRK
jgi:hypothetical protein